jgi:hypothetical protein
MLGTTLLVTLLSLGCEGGVLGLGGPSEPPPPGVGWTKVFGVWVTANAQVDPDSSGWVTISLNLWNETRAPILVEWRQTPGCALWRRAYRAGGGTEAAWDPSRRDDVACRMILRQTRVPPRSRASGPETRLHALEVLGDSLPAGDYNLTLTVAPLGKTVELFAGTVRLARPGE